MMNKLIKAILLGLKDHATDIIPVPGVRLIISSVEKLIDKDKSNNFPGIVDLSDGVIDAVEGLKGEEIADQDLFNLALDNLRLGFTQLRQSLKK